MKLAAMLKQLWRAHRYATPDDIRNVFGDYHNALHWLAAFLLGDDKLADDCIVDACTVAQAQSPVFHEWLVHWAARATFRSALQVQYPSIAEIARDYEKDEPVRLEHPPLSPGHFELLVKDSEDIRHRLDVVCRFVLVMRGIAKDSSTEVGSHLGMSESGVERAYRVAYDAIDSRLQRGALQ
jgi:DNA-directed RNA polymerase specialized sigma24 family protein